MAVSAIDNPAQVVISQDGVKGNNGTNGADGIGFNDVRKGLIDNPLSWLYGKNNLVRVLKNTLSVTRTTSGAYTDIYGQAEVADNDTPREEVAGWLIDGDEVHTYQVFDNVPQINGDFTVVVRLGGYSENTPSQDLMLIPALSGDLLTVGTDALGNWIATLQGSDTTQYEAITTVSATSAVQQTATITYTASSGVLDVYIDSVLSGAISLPTFTTAALDTDGDVTITGDFSVNIKGIRFYDFVLNQEEITYLN